MYFLVLGVGGIGGGTMSSGFGRVVRVFSLDAGLARNLHIGMSGLERPRVAIYAALNVSGLERPRLLGRWRALLEGGDEGLIHWSLV